MTIAVGGGGAGECGNDICGGGDGSYAIAVDPPVTANSAVARGEK